MHTIDLLHFNERAFLHRHLIDQLLREQDTVTIADFAKFELHIAIYNLSYNNVQIS